jgi:formiminotetrahydrofolate cyclodeaminase
MSTWAAIVSIVAIVFGADTIAKLSKNKRSRKAVDSDLEEALAQVQKLEDRIQVLERIVTENKFDLRSEINKL